MNIIIRFKMYWLLVIVLTLSTTLSQAQLDSPVTIGYCSSMPPPETLGDNLVSGVGEKNSLWNVGQTLRVEFLDGSTLLRQKVIQYATIWEQYANIKFDFVQSGSSDIRISFAIKGIFQSQVGTDAKGTPSNRPTMYLGFSENAPESEFSRLILHEFGHAIGLQHEHQHPENNIQWNKPVVYQWFLDRLGWSREVVDFNLFQAKPKNTVYYCAYNPSSIMHYFILQEFTLNNFEVGDNTTLSTEDKNFIQKLYPTSERGNPICGACTDCVEEYTLVTRIQGNGTISANPSSGNNTNCSANCAGIYATGTVVRLSATPNTGYRFVRWSGANCTNNASTNCSVTVNNNEVVSAIFEKIPDNTMSISIEGNGSIRATANEVIQDCSSNCVISYEPNQAVQLMAIPNKDYQFVRWTGTVCNNSTATNCRFTMERNQEVTAIFEKIASKNLSVVVNGNGSIELQSNNAAVYTCTNSCTYNAPENSPLELVARPATGYRFVEWQGEICNSRTNTTCSLILSRDLNVEAVFEPIPPSSNQLTVEIVGLGAVIVSDNNQTEICETNCELNYPRNSSIQLWANPANGYRFDSWVGIACNGSPAANCSLELTSSQGIIARFEPIHTNDICISFSATATNVTCNTGSVSVRIDEGLAPFTIRVNGPISGDATVNNTSFRIEDFRAGNYTINIQDAAGCETTEQFSIANTCAQGNLSDVVAARSKISNDSKPIPMITQLSHFPTIMLNNKSVGLSLTEAINPSSIVDLTATFSTRTLNMNTSNSNVVTGFQKGERATYIEELSKDTARAQQQREKQHIIPLCTARPLNFTSQNEQAQGVFERNRLWDVGQTIRVKFLGGEQELKNKIIQGAREWERYANIKFQFVTSGPAEIRIGFIEGVNNSSQIGTEALRIEETRETMNFSFFDDATEKYIWWVIRHEFGHALGLLHEHLHPKNNINWDKDFLYEYQRPLSKEEVNNLFFNTYDEDNVYFCEYDPLSVMHYAVSNNYTLDNFTVGTNIISQEDKNFIGRLYPFSGIRNPLDCGFCSDDCGEKNLSIKINGGGSVVSIESGGPINQCNSNCAESYEEGTQIVVNAIPDQGYQFVGWQGGGCGNESSCSLTLNSHTTITARFEKINVPSTKELKIRVDGEGSVIINAANTSNTCNHSCTFIYNGPLDFQLQAVPATGHHFVRWEGNYCSNTLANCEFEINVNETIRAIFAEDASCLDLTVTPRNSNCNTGIISVAITDGSAPFNIAISGPISGDASTNNTSFIIEDLPSGAYTILLVDAMGCEATQDFSIANTCLNGETNASNRSKSTASSLKLIVEEKSRSATALLEVSPNYPNPFRERTAIPFTLTARGTVSLEIFHSNGQKVYQSEQFYEAGDHQIELGATVLQQSGLYIYHFKIDEALVIGKMIRL